MRAETHQPRRPRNLRPPHRLPRPRALAWPMMSQAQADKIIDDVVRTEAACKVWLAKLDQQHGGDYPMNTPTLPERQSDWAPTAYMLAILQQLQEMNLKLARLLREQPEGAARSSPSAAAPAASPQPDEHFLRRIRGNVQPTPRFATTQADGYAAEPGAVKP